MDIADINCVNLLLKRGSEPNSSHLTKAIQAEPLDVNTVTLLGTGRWCPTPCSGRFSILLTMSRCWVFCCSSGAPIHRDIGIRFGS